MRSLLLLPLLAVIALAAGCTLFAPPPPTPTPTPPGQTIPFETLVLDAWAGNEDPAVMQDPAGNLEPVTLLIPSTAGLAALSQRVSPEVLALLEQVDYGEACVLALFRGFKGSSGYDTEIQRLSVQGDTLFVYADFWEPGNTEAAAAETSPRHIVKLSCALLPQPPAALQIELVPEIKTPPSRRDS